MSGELIVGYDGSPCAKQALEVAAAQASKTGSALVVAFFADPPAALSGGAGDQRRVLTERGEELMDEARGLLSSSTVHIETMVIDNKPAQGLVALADERNAAMIVVGTYSERPLAAALVGSTPHKLLHLSNHPVLVVPVPDEE